MSSSRIRLAYRVIGGFVAMVVGLTAVVFGGSLQSKLYFYPGTVLFAAGALCFVVSWIHRYQIRARTRRRAAASAKKRSSDNG